jgi:two-component system chemotaxis sensor kinase CheA
VDELLGEFIAETLETLETLSGEVVAWENDPTDRHRLDAFFRFFHTVKGSCGFLNLRRFERLSHAAEDTLAQIREGKRSADAATISAVLAVMDRIALLANALSSGETEPDESEDDIILYALTDTPQSIAQAIEKTPPDASNVQAENGDTIEKSHANGRDRDRGPRTVRITLSLIDQLMNGVSDMVLARNELARKLRDSNLDSDVENSFERLSTCVAEMRDIVSRTRMQRVDRLFAAIPRMVRDLSQDLGKKVELVLEGGDVEMDREMIEMVVDPLTHIVRNALDHGIERPDERISAGKSEVGIIRVAARQSGNQIVIEIVDNGRGIDTDALLAKAERVGLVSPAEAATLTESDRINLIFHPGLSTAREVSAISGRGVGMDVVRNNVERIGGIVSLESALGRGTAIQLRVPMTLTIIPGLILRCGDSQFAIPRGNVIELLFENSAMVTIDTIAGAKIATIRGTRYSLIDLNMVLGGTNITPEGRRTLMLIRSPSGLPFALRVDSVENNEELVIRPASPQVMAAGIFAGMTLPDTGRPMLLLDPAGIAQLARLNAERAESSVANLPSPQSQAQEDENPTIQALHFIEMTGQHRLIALEVVERIEDIPADRFGTAAGGHFVRLQDRLAQVANCFSPESGLVKTLHLRADQRTICYVVNDVVDIVEMPVRPELLADRDGISGIVSIEGRNFEVVDTHQLFAATDGGPQQLSGRGVCLVDGLVEDDWMRTILAPLLINAGYEVRDASLEAGPGVDGPMVILRESSRAATKHAPEAPVINIRPHAQPICEPDATSVYRYDRMGLLATIEDLLRSQAA